MMTLMQRNALEHPCRLATETIHPRFAWRLAGGLSLLLTVNNGYE